MKSAVTFSTDKALWRCFLNTFGKGVAGDLITDYMRQKLGISKSHMDDLLTAKRQLEKLKGDRIELDREAQNLELKIAALQSMADGVKVEAKLQEQEVELATRERAELAAEAIYTAVGYFSSTHWSVKERKMMAYLEDTDRGPDLIARHGLTEDDLQAAAKLRLIRSM